MSEIDINLLRKDECQPLTTEQMTDIKSQFHPSNTANVNIVPYEIYDEDGEEQVVGEVRKTIDGVKKKKPKYKKVVDCGNLPNATSKTFYHNIENIDEIISAYSYYVDPNATGDDSGYHAPLPQGHPSVLTHCYGFAVSRVTCWCRVGDDLRNNKWIAVIEYTKTTDTWQPV